MNLLFLGDLVGKNSYYFLKKNLKNICNKYKISCVVVNGENVANGYGINPDFCDNLFEIGVSVISSGNHIWDQQEIIPYIAKNTNLIRPHNLTKESAGKGFHLYETNENKKILVINLMCNLFMRKSDNLFESINFLLEKYKLKQNCDAIIIDLHGEAASEKQAFAYYVDGKVSAVIGTHTHVPTSDLRILPSGTVYQTDAGMCGDYDSVIGGNKKDWIKVFLNDNKTYHKINSAYSKNTLCGVIIRISEDTGLSTIAKQLILGDILENKIPNEKYFLE
jgi:metallophosphoesterase (TIGR00282 family)